MAGKDYYGDFSQSQVPKKAIQAQDIIYQASALLAVVSKAGIPTVRSNDLMYKEDVTRGRVGEFDVQVDAAVDHRRIVYQQMKAALKWAVFPYLIPDGAKLQSREPNQMWKDSVANAAEYFASIRDYVTLVALRAGNGASSTAAAAAKWNAANADADGDIITALSYVSANSNLQTDEKLSVVVPASVAYELKKLTLIQNIQRTMEDYLSKNFNLQFFAYRAMLDDAGTAVNDGLSTSALVFAQGANTAKALEFNPAMATNVGVPLVEHSRVHGRGDLYTHKGAFGALVTWDGVETYSAESPLSRRIYEITTVV